MAAVMMLMLMMVAMLVMTRMGKEDERVRMQGAATTHVTLWPC